MGPISCSETSVKIYHYTLLNNPEERRSHLQRNSRLKSRMKYIVRTAPSAQDRHILLRQYGWKWRCTYRLGTYEVKHESL